MPILIVNNLKIKDRRSGLELVKGISFTVEADRCLGLVGENGSGKSLTCKAVMGGLDPWLEVGGEIIFEGENLLCLPESKMRAIRGARIGMIIQEAQSAFDPLFKIGSQMTETLMAHKNCSREQAWGLAERALVGFQLNEPKSVMLKYAHQLSGGMLQRVMGGLTLALSPELIIADEPTTALDSITQKEVLDQLMKMKEMKRASMIFVSHDLGLVRRLADQVVVLRRGRIVEQGSLFEVFENPASSYTKNLIEAHRALSDRFREMVNRIEAA